MGPLVRFGFWGLGAVAGAMADDLRLVPGAALHAVASRNGAAVAAFGERHGVRRRHVGLDALLADAEVDVVYIATPALRHAEDCLAAIAAGKHVLCEKPFTMNAEEAAAVASAAEHRGLFCMEAMWTRFVPAVQEAKRAVVEGRIGRVRLMTGDFAYPSKAEDSSRLLDSEAGGGALLDRGIYLVSLAQHLLGEAGAVRAMATGADQIVWTLRFTDGALASFAASMATRGRNACAIHGETGTVVLEDPFYRPHRVTTESFLPATLPIGGARPRRVAVPALQAWRRRMDGILGRVAGRRTGASIFPGHGYQFQLREVVRCVSAGLLQSEVMPLADSVAVLRIADALRASSQA